ncbi:hypothetical protein BRDID11002_52730 [Bradyrhizobium diazoefficiens]
MIGAGIADCRLVWMKAVRADLRRTNHSLAKVLHEQVRIGPDSAYPPPIGVPASDVFPYDERCFARLALEWEATGRVSNESRDELVRRKEAAN